MCLFIGKFGSLLLRSVHWYEFLTIESKISFSTLQSSRVQLLQLGRTAFFLPASYTLGTEVKACLLFKDKSFFSEGFKDSSYSSTGWTDGSGGAHHIVFKTDINAFGADYVPCFETEAPSEAPSKTPSEAPTETPTAAPPPCRRFFRRCNVDADCCRGSCSRLFVFGQRCY